MRSYFSKRVIVALVIASSLLVACEKKQQEVNLADKWNNPSKKWTKEELAGLDNGERLYGKYCAACHLKNGQGNMTNGFPALKGSAMVTGSMVQHIRIVLHGKQGSAMPSFASLSDSELANIITYERNAWSNNSGDWLAAKTVQQQRDSKTK